MWRAHHADYQQAFQLQPLSFAVADELDVDLSADDIDAPTSSGKPRRRDAQHHVAPGRNDGLLVRLGPQVQALLRRHLARIAARGVCRQI